MALKLKGGQAIWPLTLDIAEWSASRSFSASLSSCLQLLFPTWEHLRKCQLEHVSLRQLSEPLEYVGAADFLLHTLAKEVCDVSFSETVDLGHLKNLAFEDEVFLRYLIRAFDARGAKIFGSCSEYLVRRVPELKLLARVHRATSNPAMKRFFRFEDLTPDMQMVAACPRGVPGSIVNLMEIDGQLVDVEAHHDGTNWISVREEVSISCNTTKGRSARFEARLRSANMWPTHGWNYIRRLEVARWSKRQIHVESYDIKHAFVAYSVGWSTSYLRANIRASLRAELSSATVGPINIAFICEMSIAIAHISHGAKDERNAGRLLLTALALCASEPNLKIRVVYEAANVFARLRDTRSLAMAHDCIRTGFATLVDLSVHEKQRYRCLLLNTLALIYYHKNLNGRALRSERRSITLAANSPDDAVRRRTTAALKLNLARLLERRFGDKSAAVRELSDGTSQDSPEIRAPANIRSAQLYAELGEWELCSDAARRELDAQGSCNYSPANELSLRLLLVVAGRSLGNVDDAKSQEIEAHELSARIGINSEVSEILRQLDRIGSSNT